MGMQANQLLRCRTEHDLEPKFDFSPSGHVDWPGQWASLTKVDSQSQAFPALGKENEMAAKLQQQTRLADQQWARKVLSPRSQQWDEFAEKAIQSPRSARSALRPNAREWTPLRPQTTEDHTQGAAESSPKRSRASKRTKPGVLKASNPWLPSFRKKNLQKLQIEAELQRGPPAYQDTAETESKQHSMYQRSLQKGFGQAHVLSGQYNLEAKCGLPPQTANWHQPDHQITHPGTPAQLAWQQIPGNQPYARLHVPLPVNNTGAHHVHQHNLHPQGKTGTPVNFLSNDVTLDPSQAAAVRAYLNHVPISHHQFTTQEMGQIQAPALSPGFQPMPFTDPRTEARIWDLRVISQQPHPLPDHAISSQPSFRAWMPEPQYQTRAYHSARSPMAGRPSARAVPGDLNQSGPQRPKAVVHGLFPRDQVGPAALVASSPQYQPIVVGADDLAHLVQGPHLQSPAANRPSEQSAQPYSHQHELQALQGLTPQKLYAANEPAYFAEKHLSQTAAPAMDLPPGLINVDAGYHQDQQIHNGFGYPGSVPAGSSKRSSTGTLSTVTSQKPDRSTGSSHRHWLDLAKEKDIDRIGSLCHMMNVKGQHKKLPRHCVETLVDHQLQSGRPLHAPWYRSRTEEAALREHLSRENAKLKGQHRPVARLKGKPKGTGVYIPQPLQLSKSLDSST